MKSERAIKRSEAISKMNEIQYSEETLEYNGTISFDEYFGKVDWNKLCELTTSGCHCIWVESDLVGYITVYGKERDCVSEMLKDIQDYINTLEEK